MEEEKKVTESHKIESATVSEPVKKYVWWIIGGIVLLAAIVLAVSYFFRRNKNSSGNPLDNIRQAFPATSTPPTSTPSGLTNLPPAPTSTPAQTPTPTPPARRNNQTPATPPPAPANFEYVNPALGFAFHLPSSWQVDTGRSSNTSIAFISNSLRKQGFVEVYPNTSRETLDSLASTLAGSPSVVSISRTVLAGQPAIFFRGTTAQQNGVTAINNDKVYYLRGNLAEPQVAQSFQFR